MIARHAHLSIHCHALIVIYLHAHFSIYTMRGRGSYVALVDPLSTIGPVLDRRPVGDTCCCLCCKMSRTKGIHLALALIMGESIWHITLSAVQPDWGWSYSNATVIGFYQNACRFVLIPLCGFAWIALIRGKDGVAEMRAFLRCLVILFILTLFELAITAVQDNPGCHNPLADLPEGTIPDGVPLDVWAKQAGLNVTGYTPSQCELVADLVDFAWGLTAVIIIATVIRVVHSHVASLGGNVWSESRPGSASTTNTTGGSGEQAAEVEMGAVGGGTPAASPAAQEEAAPAPAIVARPSVEEAEAAKDERV